MDPQNFSEIQAKIQEQIERLTKLNSTVGGNFNQRFLELNRDIDKANALLIEVNKELREATDLALSFHQSITGVVIEMSKGRSTVNQITKSTRDLLSISEKLLNHQENIVKLSEKDLLKEKEKANVSIANLNRLQEQAKRISSQTAEESGFHQKTIDKLKEQSKNLTGIIALENLFINQLQHAADEAKAVEEALGLSGAVLKSIINLPGLSEFATYFKLDESLDHMQQVSRELIEAVRGSKEFKGQFDELNKAIAETSDNIVDLQIQLQELPADDLEAKEQIENKIYLAKQKQESLQESLTEKNKETAEVATSFLGKLTIGVSGAAKTIENFVESMVDPAVIFTTLVKAAGSINKEVVGLQKSLALSYGSAQELRKEFTSIATWQRDTFYTTKKLLEAQSQYNEILGLQGRIYEENSLTFVDLTKRLGIASDSAAKLQFFAEATNADFNNQKLNQYEITQLVSHQLGVQLNHKQVMEAVGKAGAYALAQNNGSVEALTAAVAQAKALGTSLEQVNGIAGQLLNFEGSITNELKAELLLGRDINLERARLAALNNDQVRLMAEIKSQMGDFHDFTSMNVIQQQAFAEALGMNVNQLSDMLLLDQYRSHTYEQIVAESGKEVADRVEALTIQENFNAAIEKMKDMVANLVEGPLGTLADIFSTILGNTVAMSTIFTVMLGSTILSGIANMGKFLMLSQQLLAVEKQTAITKGISAALSNPLTALAALAVAGIMIGGIAALIKSSEPADDLVSDGYGKRVLSTPEGTFALNNRDTVIAGTNLFRGNDVISSGAGQVSLTPQDNKVGERTNMLLERLIVLNENKQQLSPVDLYQVQ